MRKMLWSELRWLQSGLIFIDRFRSHKIEHSQDMLYIHGSGSNNDLMYLKQYVNSYYSSELKRRPESYIFTFNDIVGILKIQFPIQMMYGQWTVEPWRWCWLKMNLFNIYFSPIFQKPVKKLRKLTNSYIFFLYIIMRVQGKA